MSGCFPFGGSEETRRLLHSAFRRIKHTDEVGTLMSSELREITGFIRESSGPVFDISHNSNSQSIGMKDIYA